MIIEPLTRVVYATMAGQDTGGIYRSTDLGESWTALEGLPVGDRRLFYGIAFSPDFQELYVSAIDYGVYRSSLVSHASGPLNVPSNNFVLHPSYPNPFNATTNIEFELPVTSYVSLKVFDVLGREVVTLAEGDKRAGSHKVILNASELSSGVYFYRLNVGNVLQAGYSGTIMRKLLLLK